VTTSNTLDPTTSSILLAKRLAFPSALDFPVNLNNPEQSRTTYAARPNEQEPGAWQGSAILGTEKTVRTVMAGNVGIFVRGENPQLIPTGSPEQVKPAARLNPILQRAKLWWCTPSPRLAILMIGFVLTES
jgi:hypothetical protein